MVIVVEVEDVIAMGVVEGDWKIGFRDMCGVLIGELDSSRGISLGFGGKLGSDGNRGPNSLWTNHLR